MERIEVTGSSMRPALEEGDRLLVVVGLRARRGDVVALTDPRDRSRLLVKRVRDVAGGHLDVRGDDPEHSTDSRTFGPVAATSVRGRAVYRYHPPQRAGRLAR